MVKLVHIVAFFGDGHEAVEEWLMVAEGLAVRVVEIAVLADVVDFVAASLGETAELDVDRRGGGSEAEDSEFQQLDHFGLLCMLGLCEEGQLN